MWQASGCCGKSAQIPLPALYGSGEQAVAVNRHRSLSQLCMVVESKLLKWWAIPNHEPHHVALSGTKRVLVRIVAGIVTHDFAMFPYRPSCERFPRTTGHLRRCFNILVFSFFSGSLSKPVICFPCLSQDVMCGVGRPRVYAHSVRVFTYSW